MTSLNAAVVVQARMGSSRLPGKVARPFGESTLLQHILRRIKRSRRSGELWVATTDSAEDDLVAELSTSEGASVFRGPAEDVLGRFRACLDGMEREPDAVVRVCADRPFVCPVLLDELLEFFELTGRPDYLANTRPESFPVGLDLEVIATHVLRSADEHAIDPYDREHVTPYVYEHPEAFALVNFSCSYGNFSSVRAVIDTAGDYDALVPVHEVLADRDPDYDYRDLLNLAATSPSMLPLTEPA